METLFLASEIAPEAPRTLSPALTIIIAPIFALLGVLLGEILRWRRDEKTLQDQRRASHEAEISDATIKFIAASRLLFRSKRRKSLQIPRHNRLRRNVKKSNLPGPILQHVLSVIEEQGFSNQQRLDEFSVSLQSELARLQLNSPELFPVALEIVNEIRGNKELTAEQLDERIDLLVAKASKLTAPTPSPRKTK